MSESGSQARPFDAWNIQKLNQHRPQPEETKDRALDWQLQQEEFELHDVQQAKESLPVSRKHPEEPL